MAAQPWLWIIAGANGTGKSSLATKLRTAKLSRIPADALWLNPDEDARVIRGNMPDLEQNAVDYAAIIQTDNRVAACLAGGESCVVETVLTHEKHRIRYQHARDAGYKVGLIYVALSDVRLAVARVAARVQLGGHNVPLEKIISRWDGSLESFQWFASRVDDLMVFLNDDPEPLTVVSSTNGKIVEHLFCPPHIATRLPLGAVRQKRRP